MEIDPEQIPERLPDPETHPQDRCEYFQVTRSQRPIVDSFSGLRIGAVLESHSERVILKRKRLDFPGLEWRFEYLRWKSGNGTKRRLHAGMIQDAVLLAVIEDLRRDLRPPNELGQRCMETNPGWMPMIEAHFAAVRCVHTIVGWAEYEPRRQAWITAD